MIAVLGSRSITDEILSSTMCQVDQTLNARPLTPVSNYSSDLKALTPNHFVIGRPNISVPYIPNAKRYSDLKKNLLNLASIHRSDLAANVVRSISTSVEYENYRESRAI